jgi:hypothetical protein
MARRRASRRRHKRNPGGLWGFASKHPWLTVLFVIPALVYLPVRLIQAARGDKPYGGTAPRLSGVR